MPPEKRAAAKTRTTKKPASATTRRTRKRTAPTSDQIAERAYFIHLDEGGEPFGNWLRAERELVAV
jgi:hypothetical protein